MESLGREDGPNGRYHLRLRIDGRAVSWCEVVPLTLRYGASTLRVDGISDVWTEPDQRRRGYARRALTAAIESMTGGDAALSLLYGIEDLYPKFDYATTGADFGLRLRELEGPDGAPEGWSERLFEPGDLAAVREVYERTTPGAVGPAVRAADDPVWEWLASGDEADPCRLVVDPAGRVAGYAWRGTDLNYVELAERYFPRALVLAEAVAESPTAAAAVVALCRRWGRATVREEGPATTVSVGALPGGHVWRAAALTNADRIHYSWRSAGPMVRLLSARRLFEQARAELSARAAEAAWHGVAAFAVGAERVSLAIEPEGVRVVGDGEAPALEVALPPPALARLAWGGFPPEDALEGLEPAPGREASALLRALFPERRPYVYTADRP